MSIPDRVIEVPPSNVRNSEGRPEKRFDQGQKEWSDELTREATAYLCEWYDVDESDIYDVESHFDREYATDDALRLLHILDYSGLDLRVDCSYKMVDVALRIRPTSDEYDVDFSFRVENGIEGKDAEYDKWLNAYREGDGYYPGVAAFGVANADETAFEEFHLIAVEPFLEAIEAGELVGDGPYPSPGGAEALYYSIESLRDAGCILRSWNQGESA